MRAFIKFLESLIDAILLNTAMTQAEAVAMLQSVTDGIDNATAFLWLGHVAAYYQSIGVISSATFDDWRDMIAGHTDAESKTLLAAIAVSIIGNPAISEVNTALRNNHFQKRAGRLNDDIQRIKTFRDSQTDDAIIKALNIGLREIRQRRKMARENRDDPRVRRRETV